MATIFEGKPRLAVGEKPGPNGGVCLHVHDGRTTVELEVPSGVALAFLADLARVICVCAGAPPPFVSTLGEGGRDG